VTVLQKESTALRGNEKPGEADLADKKITATRAATMQAR
jgi:hypothetical protein